ncbi:MAG: biotin/lipoyl-binding protein, partial [Burkholderiaceae bacterium]
MRRTFAPIRLIALALPVLSLALVLPTTAIAQSSVAVKTALFKDIASYPEQHVPAQVVAANRVQIAAQISGVVQTWRVDAGAKVNRGTTLAQLDPRDMSLVLAQAQAAQKAAQAR